ncbi:acyl-CoA dehydrogenase family protein [Ferrimicrobium sp.]|uniref:acyl-CoA dehydrogenase family protein n=1 Tax=Ferrimicrobium sp. TaxID=2926050 RepID=UPI0026302931|nr:acyl-CoA dehydrogenase family protein [Ferrimicrobium sp.]
MTETLFNHVRSVLGLLNENIQEQISRLEGSGRLEHAQVESYQLSTCASALLAIPTMLAYADHGEHERAVATVFCLQTLRETAANLLTSGLIDPAAVQIVFSDQFQVSDSLIDTIALNPGPAHLSPDLELVAETFRRVANEKIAPLADDIHRNNLDIPEAIINQLAQMGAFGLSIPEEFGGSSNETADDLIAMLVATEELSRASLGAGGSLITRPEILAKAILAGGTEEQKQRFLPALATGELMGAVAVTEPDFGSDVANIATTATPVDGGWRINGTKTWCTFAGRAEILAVLARTDPDRRLGHRGLSLFLVDKPRADGESFRSESNGGVIEGRAIATLGYRGMHSFEVSFDNVFVPAAQLVGEASGQGRGFYLQMAGFENGRIQTAARAVGVMGAAYDAACAYASTRSVFGQPLVDYRLSRAKLARMAATLQASRQVTYATAGLLAQHQGSLEASMAKAYTCRAAEWITREAMQLHGGMGYAEEYPVSRYFVDARVLSIFEGAEETLALKVIARGLARR